MKLIHTSDWHLGSPMEHRLGREKADMRRRELLSRFADMMIYAREQNIDAVLLCGDLSDDGILPAETQDYLLSTEQRYIRYLIPISESVPPHPHYNRKYRVAAQLRFCVR